MGTMLVRGSFSIAFASEEAVISAARCAVESRRPFNHQAAALEPRTGIETKKQYDLLLAPMFLNAVVLVIWMSIKGVDVERSNRSKERASEGRTR